VNSYPLGLITNPLNATGGATVTGTTNETVLGSIAVPANSMGQSGGIRVMVGYQLTVSANQKSIKLRFGLQGSITSQLLFDLTGSATTANVGAYNYIGFIHNPQVAPGVQLGHFAWFNTAGSSQTAFTLDTTQNPIPEFRCCARQSGRLRNAAVRAR
jgi:hypothetical protein